MVADVNSGQEDCGKNILKAKQLNCMKKHVNGA